MTKKAATHTNETANSIRNFFKRISIYHWILFGIIILGTFFRFAELPTRYGFDFDSSRDAIFSQLGAEEFRLPNLGPASALGPFHFGPMYYYQLILFRSVVPSLYAPWIYVALLSILAIAVGYKIGEEMGSKVLGLIIAWFIALSPAQIIPATGLSNPNLVVLPSFVAVWLFLKIVNGKASLLTTFLFGLWLVIGLNNHFQMLPLFILPVIAFFFAEKKIIYLIRVGLGMLLGMLPYLFYEVSHQFQNTSGFFFYLREGRDAVYLPNSWKIYLFEFWPDFLSFTGGLPLFLVLLLLTLTGMICLVMFKSKQWNKPILLLLLVMSVQFLFLRFIASREIYYVYYLHPLIFIALSVGIAGLFEHKIGRVIGIILLVIVGFYSLQSANKAMFPPESHRETKVLADYLDAYYPDRKIIIFGCGERVRGTMMGVVYLLQEEREQKQPVTVGILDMQSCPSEYLKADNIKRELPTTELHKAYYNNRMIRFVEFKSGEAPVASPSGWNIITFEMVYDENEKKWFR